MNKVAPKTPGSYRRLYKGQNVKKGYIALFSEASDRQYQGSPSLRFLFVSLSLPCEERHVILHGINGESCNGKEKEENNDDDRDCDVSLDHLVKQ
ncbi:hypothetical protein N7490_003045 [Penicillium lividum]|nr:hypothetical protein N7490_003045 [Penicillium lividum]